MTGPRRAASRDAGVERSAPTLTVLAAIVAFGAGLPVVTGLATGAFGILHNDDWAYSRIALELAADGELELVGWNQMSLVGHLLWALPFAWVFGASLETLHAAQAVAAALGLVLTFLVLRRFLAAPAALLGTALVAVFPGYALLAGSYMTDTTAFAAQMGCLLLGLLAFERASRARTPLLLAAVATGFFAFTIREPSIAAPLAVLAGAFVAAEDRKGRAEATALAAGLVGAAVAFFLWRHSLPGDEKPWLIGDASAYERVADVARSYFTVAFALLPALVLLALRSRRRLLSPWTVGAGLVVLAVGATVAARSIGGPLTLFAGNALTRVGAVDVALPGRPVLFPRSVWALMTLGALAGGVLLAVLAARAIREKLDGRRAGTSAPAPAAGRAGRLAVAAYLALTAAFLLVRAAAGTSGLYDRYLWAAAVAVLVLLPAAPAAAGRRRLPEAAAALAVVAIALVSLAVLLEENASSAARWKAGEAAVARGLAPTSVDAGFEWMGWHYPHLVGEPEGAAAWAEPVTWYNALEFPAASNCVLMSYAPRTEPWLAPVEVREYDAFLALSGRSVYVYRNEPACTGNAAVEPVGPFP